MDILLLHDDRVEPPLDVYAALQEAGHRVVSHDADANGLPVFLDAMRYGVDVVVADLRGDAGRVLAAVEVLGHHERTRGRSVLFAHVPDAVREATAALAGGRVADDDIVAAVAEATRP